jgi:hypothetical protein
MTEADMFPGKIKYRVWPDGTVQDAEDTPHGYMSDDYLEVWAVDMDTAADLANGY